ncbi:MAG TPA: pallilysin-related adhesin [Treponemataceae bacterium]|jgi:hypothetical protein|nr:pallilysin-related adhesin [Treponemataceae bacterium]
MKRNITILLFFLIAAILLFLFLGKEVFIKDDASAVRARTVIPVANTEEQTASIRQSSSSDDLSLTSLIPLLVDEILINAISFDFNSDGYEDQIIAVKKANNPHLVIVTGLYNPNRMTYERFFQYQTKISQSKTFSLSVMDLTGSQTNNLIYTGFTDLNESVLEAFTLTPNPAGYELTQIISLYSEGTILIQQAQPKGGVLYEQAEALTYPIMVYSTEITADKDTFDQLQTIYVWSDLEQAYIKGTETRVPGKKIEAKELSKIQDGTIESFAGFLTGLWALSTHSGLSTQYLFFDYAAKEIIFSQENTQEVYSWVNSTLRRNGVYLSTVNTSISNLTRYFDISLVSLDEVKIKINDDVGMVINSDTLWDGVYKKVQQKNIQSSNTEPSKGKELLSELENNEFWKVMEADTISFNRGTYSFFSGSIVETGIYSQKTVNGKHLIQIRSDAQTSLFGGFYSIEKKEEFIYLQPVRITADGIISSSGAKIELIKPVETN